MDVWIALLRGVNVGGHKKLPMARFRATLTGLGFRDVATYIQSGNAVFRAAGSANEIGNQIGTAIADEFGFDTDVMVLSLQELRTAVGNNPFPAAILAPTTLHLFFLAAEPSMPDTVAMAAVATRGEEFQLAGQVFYFHTPNGMGKSALAGKLGRFIDVPMTGRNLRSCHRLIELAGRL